MSFDPAHIVRLGVEDVARLRALNAVVASAFDEPPADRGPPPTDDESRRRLSQDHVIVLAALAEEVVVGGIVAYELDRLDQTRNEIYLYDLAVATPHRRRGIATALIGRLQAIAAERGASVVYVQADPADLPAIALYARLGTREDVVHFEMPPRR